MKSRKWFIALAGIVLVIAVGLLVGLVAWPGNSSGGETQPSSHIPEEQALDSVRVFEGKSLPDLVVVNMPDDNLHQAIELKSGKSTYAVNADTGAVEMALYLDVMNEGKTERVLPLETAKAAATAFAQAHYAPFADLTLIEGELLDHGSGGKEYLFVWAEVINGATTPNKVYISVNPSSGGVFSYIAKHQTVEPFAPPNIEAEDASALARKAYAQRTGVKDLTVVGDPALEVVTIYGQQCLVWVVEMVESYTPDGIAMGARFFIDARTGAVIQEFVI